jgi:hypothetical protein
MSTPHRYLRKRLSSMVPGKPLKIREGSYKQLRDREWLLNRVENNLIFLIRSTAPNPDF